MPKKGSILSGVRVVDLVAGGDARAFFTQEDQSTIDLYFDSRSVVPGDLVEARVLGKRSGLWQARVESLTEASRQRITPRCQHFGTCGGCGLQHWNYQLQLESKQKLVLETLATLIHEAEVRPVIGCDEQWFFRNKMEFTASARPWLDKVPEAGLEDMASGLAIGLFVPFSGNKVIDVQKCLLQEPLGDAIREWWRGFSRRFGIPAYHSSRHDGWLRTLLIRTARTGESLVMFIVASEAPVGGPHDTMECMVGEFCRDFPQVSSVWTLINPKLNDSYADIVPRHVAGKEKITELLDGLNFQIGPQTFFQVNSRQTEILYRQIIDLADLKNSDVIYDLYCGVGSISLFLAHHARKVIGIDYVESSIDSARNNATINGFENTVFLAGDMKELLTPELFTAQGHPDIMVTDPPRAGMHPKACQVLGNSGVRRIVYVSCNPLSLARDLAILQSTYRVVTIQVVDLMPQSHHVETIVVMDRR